MPSDWYGLPAYHMDANNVFRIHTLRRGDPKPDRDMLELERTLWLDFDGQGYTLADHLRGRITSLSRLSMAPPISLGRVAVNGQNRLITHLPGAPGAGVEIRSGNFE